MLQIAVLSSQIHAVRCGAGPFILLCKAVCSAEEKATLKQSVRKDVSTNTDKRQFLQKLMTFGRLPAVRVESLQRCSESLQIPFKCYLTLTE